LIDPAGDDVVALLVGDEKKAFCWIDAEESGRLAVGQLPPVGGKATVALWFTPNIATLS
jgi:hypothetical protein